MRWIRFRLLPFVLVVASACIPERTRQEPAPIRPFAYRTASDRPPPGLSRDQKQRILCQDTGADGHTVAVIQAGLVLDPGGQPLELPGPAQEFSEQTFEVVARHLTHIAVRWQRDGLSMVVWVSRRDLQSWLVDGAYIRPRDDTTGNDVWLYVPPGTPVTPEKRAESYTEVKLDGLRPFETVLGKVRSNLVDEVLRRSERPLIKAPTRVTDKAPDLKTQRGLDDIPFHDTSAGVTWFSIKPKRESLLLFKERTEAERTLVRYFAEDGSAVSAWIDNEILEVAEGEPEFGQRQPAPPSAPSPVVPAATPADAVPGGTLLGFSADGPAVGVLTKAKPLDGERMHFDATTIWGSVKLHPLRDGAEYQRCPGKTGQTTTP